MHEMSIARAIYRQIELAEQEQNGMQPIACEVEVGPLSGIEPLCLQAAFADLMNEVGRMIGLSIQEIPLRGRCSDCHTESSIDGFQFNCSMCGGPRMQVTSGDQVQLVSIDFL